MKKIIMVIIFVIVCLFIVVGVIHKNRIKTYESIDPMEADIEYTITHKCLEASTITTTKNNKKSLSYFSQCICFVSDGNSEPIGIDVINGTHFEALDKQETVDLCNDGCQELCEKEVKRFLDNNPDFKMTKRW